MIGDTNIQQIEMRKLFQGWLSYILENLSRQGGCDACFHMYCYPVLTNAQLCSSIWLPKVQLWFTFEGDSFTLPTSLPSILVWTEFEPHNEYLLRSLQDKISLKTCVFRFRANHKNVWVRKSRNFWLSISVISEWAINICNNAIIVEKLFLFVNSDLKLKSVFVPSDFIYSIDWLI